MTDSLKIFIQTHRNAFDASVPGAHGWPGVARTLDRLGTADQLEKTVLLDRLLLDTEAPSDCVWENIVADLDGKAGVSSLECFIRENRDEFDTELPDLSVWKQIEQGIPAAPKPATIIRVDWQRRLLRAAASVALLVTGMGIGLWYARSTGSAAPGGMAMGEVSTEYRELEAYYQRDIAVKEEKLAQFTGNQSAEIEGDLEQMDKVMQELRQELANVPPGNREQVVRVMIENYKAKASVLQRVLQRLEELSPDHQQNNKKHENERI